MKKDIIRIGRYRLRRSQRTALRGFKKPMATRILP